MMGRLFASIHGGYANLFRNFTLPVDDASGVQSFQDLGSGPQEEASSKVKGQIIMRRINALDPKEGLRRRATRFGGQPSNSPGWAPNLYTVADIPSK